MFFLIKVYSVKQLYMINLIKIDHGEGTTDEIALYGVPYGKTHEEKIEYDTLQSAMEENHPDLVFV